MTCHQAPSATLGDDGSSLGRIRGRRDVARASNLATVVSVAGKDVLVAAPDGCLESVDLFTTNRAEAGKPPRISRVRWGRRQSCHARGWCDCHVRCLGSLSSSSEVAEPAWLAFGSSGAVHVAELTPSVTLRWLTEVSARTPVDVSFDRHGACELLVLSDDGLAVHVLESGRTFRVQEEFDIWPLVVEHDYFCARFGAHPRTATLASTNALHRLDFRCPLQIADQSTSSTATGISRSPEIIARPKQEWGLSGADRGLCLFQPHPCVPFWSYAASDTLLAVVDERMARFPLLTWSITHPSHGSRMLMSASRIQEGSSQWSDAIALSCPAKGWISVHHYTSSGNRLSTQSTSRSPPQHEPASRSDSDSDSEIAPLSRPHPVRLTSGLDFSALEWTDLPLDNLECLAPSNRPTGLALLPQFTRTPVSDDQESNEAQGDAMLSMVQVAHSGLVVAQVLGCGVYADGSRTFEGPERHISGTRPAHKRQRVDSLTALRMTQQCQDGGGNPRSGRRHFVRNEPGLDVFTFLRRLHALNAIQVQARIVPGVRDDVEQPQEKHVRRREQAISVPRPLVQLAFDSESDDEHASSNDEDQMGNIFAFLSVPRTFAEVARFIRSGRPHAVSPVDMSTLFELLTSSEEVMHYATCPTESSSPRDQSLAFVSARERENWENDLSTPRPGTVFSDLVEDLDRLYHKDQSNNTSDAKPATT